MPPVFGPRSPSSSRLWSCAVANGSAVRPSQIRKKLASSPSRKPSMTRRAPVDVGRQPAVDRAMRLARIVATTTTPLPAASPSALTTTGTPGRAASSASTWRMRVGRVVERAIRRGRDAVAFHEALREVLRPFEFGRGARRAEDAQARSPGTGRRCRRRAPRRGRRRSGRSSRARRTPRARGGPSIGKFCSRLSSAVPPLPGAT